MEKRIGILDEARRKEVLLEILRKYKSAFDSLGELTRLSAHTRKYAPSVVFLPQESLKPAKFDEEYVRAIAFFTSMMSYELGGKRLGTSGTLDALMHAAFMLKTFNEARNGESSMYFHAPQDLRIDAVYLSLENCYVRLRGIRNTEGECAQNVAAGGYGLDTEEVRIIKEMQQRNSGKLRLLPSVELNPQIVELEDIPDFGGPIILENLLDAPNLRLMPGRIYRTLGLEQSLRLTVSRSDKPFSYNWATPNFLQLYFLEQHLAGKKRYCIAEDIHKSLIPVPGTFICGAFKLCNVTPESAFRVGKRSVRGLRAYYFDTIALRIEQVIQEEIENAQPPNGSLSLQQINGPKNTEMIKNLKQEKKDLWTRGARTDRLKALHYHSLMNAARKGKHKGIDDMGQLWDSFGLAPFKRSDYPTTKEGWKDFYYSRIIPSFIRRPFYPVRKDVPEPLRIVLGFSANKLKEGQTPEGVIKEYRSYIKEKTRFDISIAPKKRELANAGFGGLLRQLSPDVGQENPGLKEMGAFSLNQFVAAIGLPINFKHEARKIQGEGLPYYLDVYFNHVLPRMAEQGIPPYLNPGMVWYLKNGFGYLPHDLTQGKLSDEGIGSVGDLLSFVGRSPFLNFTPGNTQFERQHLFMGLAEILLSILYKGLHTNITLLNKGDGRLTFPLGNDHTKIGLYVSQKKLGGSVPTQREMLTRFGYSDNRLLVVYGGPRIGIGVEGVDFCNLDELVSKVGGSPRVDSDGIRELNDVGRLVLAYDPAHPPAGNSLASRIAGLRVRLVGPSPKFLELFYQRPEAIAGDATDPNQQ